MRRPNTIGNRANWEMRMRVIALLPATCLALFATAGLTQQAASPPSPSPSPGQATGAGETTPPPSATQSAPQQGTGALRADDPWAMERQSPTGAHLPGMSFAPTLHLRYRGFVLDLPCSADVDTATCAKIALGIIDHLRRGDWGGNDDVRRDRGDRGRRRGDRDDYDEGNDSDESDDDR